MLLALLEKLARALKRRSIPYMVIGGQAVLVHGTPRTTEDIDVTLGVDVDRLDDVRALVAESGWRSLIEPPEEFVSRTMVLPCIDPATELRIDIVFSRTEYERQAIERAVPKKIGRTDVWFAAAEDLVVHKVLAGRPRDLEDARSVLLRNPQLEIPYVRQWLGTLEEAIGEPIVARLDALLSGIRT